MPQKSKTKLNDMISFPHTIGDNDAIIRPVEVAPPKPGQGLRPVYIYHEILYKDGTRERLQYQLTNYRKIK